MVPRHMNISNAHVVQQVFLNNTDKSKFNSSHWLSGAIDIVWHSWPVIIEHSGSIAYKWVIFVLFWWYKGCVKRLNANLQQFFKQLLGNKNEVFNKTELLMFFASLSNVNNIVILSIFNTCNLYLPLHINIIRWKAVWCVMC